MSRTSAAERGSRATPFTAAGATRRPFAEATTLPGRLYWDAEVYRAEVERIFTRMWICVGRRERLARPGDFFTCELAGQPLLLLADETGEPRAFHNVCRHRGTRVVQQPQGSGLKRLQCPYHAWCYGLDGRLLAAPRMNGVSGFRKADYPLLAVRLESWQGFLFVNLDERAAPLAEQLHDFPDISHYPLETLRVGAQRSYDVAANWKLICENYGECYHCPLVHPQLHRITNALTSRRPIEGENFNGGPMVMADGLNTMSMSGVTDRPPFAGLPADEQRLVHYFNLFPTFLVSLHADYVLTHTVWPLGPERVRIDCEWLFDAQLASQPDFDPADAVEFWDLTNRQDWHLCEQALIGLRSLAHRPGRYQPGERCVYSFDRWYLGRME